jgi:spore germination cell wall hydrolase CwlJ-like protein
MEINVKKILYTLILAMAGSPAIADHCSKEDQIQALALNMYHEARGEGFEAMQLVGEVTLNRVNSRHFPDGICDVVYQARVDQNGNPIRHKCQFSWYCDGRSDKPRDEEMWGVSVEIAEGLVNGTLSLIGIDATHYHTTAVNPWWSKRYTEIGRHGNHVFYYMGNRL